MTCHQKRLGDWSTNPIGNNMGTPPLEMHSVRCPHCGSDDVIKKENKKRRYKKMGKQYKCKKCGKKFMNEIAKGHYPPWVEHTVLELAKDGVNTRRIARNIEKIAERQNIDIKMAHTTVYNIINRNITVLLEFETLLDFVIEDEWEIDELFQKLINGKTAYVFNTVGTNSKFWLTSFVSTNRDTRAAIKALQLAGQRAHYHPFTIRCDGLASYRKAIKVCLPRAKIDQKPKTEDFSHINIAERLNGTARQVLQRYRHFRSIENLQNLVDLYRIHYNFIEKHRGLKGMTPAYFAGFPYQFKDWNDLLKYAQYYIRKKKYGDNT